MEIGFVIGNDDITAKIEKREFWEKSVISERYHKRRNVTSGMPSEMFTLDNIPAPQWL
jgi:hypothetical protein